MEISDPTMDFNFSNITLNNPQAIQGGSSYFSKISLSNSINKDKSLYIQLPKCKTKQGIVNTKKEKYCDFLFEKNGNAETDRLFEWIDNLEKKCQELIDSKKTLWFHNDITMEDIENMMVPVCRLYKSGRNILIRSFIDVIKKNGKEKCLAYDEQENIIPLESIKESQEVVPLLLIDGIIFSTKSFEISIKLIQIMVTDDADAVDNDVKNKCLIKPSNNLTKTNTIKETKKNATKDAEVSIQESTRELQTPLQTLSTELALTDSVIANAVDTTPVSLSVEDKLAVKTTTTPPSTPCTMPLSCIDSSNLVNSNKNTISRNDAETLSKPPNTNIFEPCSSKITNVGEIEEVHFDVNNIKESMMIKSTYEIYTKLIEDTKELKKKYINSLLIAKKFKEKYKLKDIEEDGLTELEEEEDEEEELE